MLEDRPHKARLAFPMQEGQSRLQPALFFVFLLLQALCQPFAHGLLSRRGLWLLVILGLLHRTFPVPKKGR